MPLRTTLVAVAALVLSLPAMAEAQQPAYITANPYLGTPVSEYDSRVSPYSPHGARNPYTTDGGRIYAQDGRYLGRLNANPYDPESVANPYGQYGSPYSSNSINNPYGQYGSPYSPNSARNPYTSTPPVVIYRQPGQRLGTGTGLVPGPGAVPGTGPLPGPGAALRPTAPRTCNRFLEDCP